MAAADAWGVVRAARGVVRDVRIVGSFRNKKNRHEKRACMSKLFLHKRCISNYRVFIVIIISDLLRHYNFRPKRRKLYRIFLAATPLAAQAA